jgi:hypothetical protein
MLIQTAPFITDISGKCGNQYYHRDRSGLHLSSMPKSGRIYSPAQRAGIQAFTGISDEYKYASEFRPSPANYQHLTNKLQYQWNRLRSRSFAFYKVTGVSPEGILLYKIENIATPYRFSARNLFIRGMFNAYRTVGWYVADPRLLPWEESYPPPYDPNND